MNNVTGIGIFQDRNDIATLIPFLKNMKYNPEKDEYTCHNGKQLKTLGTAHKKSATGYRSEISIYECENCSNCRCKVSARKHSETEKSRGRRPLCRSVKYPMKTS